MTRVVLGTSLLVLLATTSPVLADEYWVSQDPTSKTCDIVDKMPDGKTAVMVGATSYPTKKEAHAAKWTAIGSGACVKRSKE